MSVLTPTDLQLMVSSHVDVMMLNNVSMTMDDDHVQHLCDEASGLVVDELGHEQHALHVPQDLRDQVMSSLAHAHPKPTLERAAEAHGAQVEGRTEGDQATSHGALRLLQDSRRTPWTHGQWGLHASVIM